MAALLGLSESAAEESLNSMVVARSVEAKIDRLDGIVDFRRTSDPNEVHHTSKFCSKRVVSI